MWKFFLGLGVGAIAGMGALMYVKNRCEEDDEFAEKVDDVIESVCDGFGRAKDAIEETASQVYDSVEKKCEEIDNLCMGKNLKGAFEDIGEFLGLGESAKGACVVSSSSDYNFLDDEIEHIDLSESGTKEP